LPRRRKLIKQNKTKTKKILVETGGRRDHVSVKILRAEEIHKSDFACNWFQF
jgi:hypothetical protein